MLAFFETPIQLVPDGTLLFQVACVIVMVAVVNATLLKPINRILAERERRTRGRLSEAGAVAQEAEQKLRDYERHLREARSEGYAKLEQERVGLSREREQKLSQVREEVAQLLAAEKEKIRGEEAAARVELQRNARSTAVEISQHILNRPLQN